MHAAAQQIDDGVVARLADGKLRSREQGAEIRACPLDGSMGRSALPERLKIGLGHAPADENVPASVVDPIGRRKGSSVERKARGARTARDHDPLSYALGNCGLVLVHIAGIADERPDPFVQRP